MSLLKAANLTKRYGELVAVDDLSFEVSAGEVFGLLGPNGAGKTTTMSMLAGLLQPDSGSVCIADRPFEADNLEGRKLLGIVPQDLAIYPDLTAFENLSFFGQLYHLHGSTLKQQIASAFEQTGLTQHAHKLTRTFSGGMKRRLNFAVALLHKPRLLILDEPTVGVDPQSRAHLLESVRRLRDEGMGVVYASHYMEEVEALCDRVAIVDHGRMVACGRLVELLSQSNVDVCLRVANVSPALRERIGDALEIPTLCEVHLCEDRNAMPESTIVIKTDLQTERSNLNESLRRVLDILDECDVELRGIETNESNLERLFLQLTGHSLRD